ncbi:MAG: hypothetical protein ABIH27_07400 [Candidatus Omnitrophota bacterium]
MFFILAVAGVVLGADDEFIPHSSAYDDMPAPRLQYPITDEYSINIKSELFEDSQVYTWSLIRVSFSGQKSDKSTSSFEVIKK